MTKGKLYDFKISFISDELGIYRSDIEGALDEAKAEFPKFTDHNGNGYYIEEVEDEIRDWFKKYFGDEI